MANTGIRISYAEIELIVDLQRKIGLNEESTCFDHISAIRTENTIWTVEVFIEPVGNVQVSHQSLQLVLEFWLELFRTQPKEWSYATAGWHIEKTLRTHKFTWDVVEDARRIWSLT